MPFTEQQLALQRRVSQLGQQLEHMSQKLGVKNQTAAAAGARFSKDTCDRTCDQETRALILKRLLRVLWRVKSENVAAFQKERDGKEREHRPLHARHGGLFRCQEVCLMVMGQMREEG